MRNIRVQIQYECETCDGTGVRLNSIMGRLLGLTQNCPDCKGAGFLVEAVSLDDLWHLMNERR